MIIEPQGVLSAGIESTELMGPVFIPNVSPAYILPATAFGPGDKQLHPHGYVAGTYETILEPQGAMFNNLSVQVIPYNPTALPGGGSGLSGNYAVPEGPTLESGGIFPSPMGPFYTAQDITYILINDAGAGAEALTLAIATMLQDTGIGVEAISELAHCLIQDIAAGAELASVLSGLSVQDATQGVDIITIMASLTVVADTGAALEFLHILAAFTLADAGAGTDIISIFQQIIITDVGIAVDLAATIARITIADSTAAAELINILNHLPLTDAGAGLDLISLVTQLSINDTGAAADFVRVAAGMLIQDSGLGAEILHILVQAVLEDSGTGIDFITQILTRMRVSDTGSSLDIPSILNRFNIQDASLSSSEALTVVANILIQDNTLGLDTIQKLVIISRLLLTGTISPAEYASLTIASPRNITSTINPRITTSQDRTLPMSWSLISTIRPELDEDSNFGSSPQ